MQGPRTMLERSWHRKLTRGGNCPRANAIQSYIYICGSNRRQAQITTLPGFSYLMAGPNGDLGTSRDRKDHTNSQSLARSPVSAKPHRAAPFPRRRQWCRGGWVALYISDGKLTVFTSGFSLLGPGPLPQGVKSRSVPVYPLIEGWP